MTTEGPMAHARFRSLSQVSDHQLKAELHQFNQKSHRLEAELLLYLGELDQRRLYREEACSSAFEFCISRMGYSEDVAYKRVGAARMMRQFPRIYDLLAEGQLHLTALMLLKPHLTEANHQDWLLAACHKSKREVERLLVSRFPKPDAKASVRRLPSASLAPNELNPQSVGMRLSDTGRSAVDPDDAPIGFAEPTLAAAAAIAGTDSDAGTDSVAGTGSAMTAEPARALGLKTQPTAAAPKVRPGPAVAPLSSSTYRVTFTASEQLKQKLDRARELLSHCIPPSDLPALIERALDQLLEREQTRRYGAIPKCKPASARQVGPAKPEPELEREQTRRYGAVPKCKPASARQDGPAKPQPETVEHPANHDGAPARTGTAELSTHDRAPAKTESVSPHAEGCPRPNGVIGELAHRDSEVCPGPNAVIGEQARRDPTEANAKPCPIATQRDDNPLDPDPTHVAEINSTEVATQLDPDPTHVARLISTGIASQRGENPLDPDDPEAARVIRTVSTGSAVAKTEGVEGAKGAASNRRRQPRACVRRAVLERDAGQCTFVDPQGRRCNQRHFLQFDHIEAYAIGGTETVSNLRLRCRCHNALEAERLFGKKRVKAAIAHAKQCRTL